MSQQVFIFCHDCHEPFDAGETSVIAVRGPGDFASMVFAVRVCRACLARRNTPDVGDPEQPATS